MALSRGLVTATGETLKNQDMYYVRMYCVISGVSVGASCDTINNTTAAVGLECRGTSAKYSEPPPSAMICVFSSRREHIVWSVVVFRWHIYFVAETPPTETPRNGWGLRAERDLEAGETVAVIPRSMCLGLAQTPAEGESEKTREDQAWTGPPCIQALVEQVPEEFADVRCVS